MYDVISRVDYIGDVAPNDATGTTMRHKYDYAYKAGTPFVETVGFARGATPVLTQGYAHDSLGRFSGASAVLASGTALRGVGYEFDAMDRREQADWNDGTLWSYGYNNRSEVISGKRKFAGDGQFVGGAQFEYGFDDIGNRTVERFGGDAGGSNLRQGDYGNANALNQITTRTVPGAVLLSGSAPAAMSLSGTVNGQSVEFTRQAGDYFFGEALVNNAASAVWAGVNVTLVSGTGVEGVANGSRFVAKTPESFAYDADGNLTADGRWTYTWDAESRLTAVETAASAAAAGAPKLKLIFGYDADHRRFKKEVWTWNTQTINYQLSTTIYFTYDGWNLLGELDENRQPLRVYQWGLDLSGSPQGAGGVGGLLSMEEVTTGKVFYYTYDGNGNVQQMVDSATGSIAADYTYGPFGEPLRATGPKAGKNPFRFSTKYTDEETSLLYYGYRYYPHTTIGEHYNATGFDLANTLQSQLLLNLWFACVEKKLGRVPSLEFKRMGNPEIGSDIAKPKPIDPLEAPLKKRTLFYRR